MAKQFDQEKSYTSAPMGTLHVVLLGVLIVLFASGAYVAYALLSDAD
jgi:hypothetical protein